MSAESASRLGDVVVKRPNGDCLYKLHLSADGIILCTVIGFWEVADADLFLLDYARFIRSVRNPRNPLRILVDLTASSVMTQSLADRFATAHRELFSEQDRRAYVVTTSLQSIQQKRAASYGHMKVFLNADAAYQWLLAPAAD